MAIGNKKLQEFSQSLFPDHVPANSEDALTLYEDKVKAICARYIYYMQQPTDKRLTYSDILTILEKEFWISTKRLSDIICNQEATIQAIKSKAHKKEWFKINWAHMVW